MASSLKNAALLLSPKFLSPLSPSRNLVNFPRSDGKVFFRQSCRPNVAKKLNFSPTNNCLLTLSKAKSKIPDIRIEKVVDVGKPRFESTLEINTPNKLDLARHGLGKFRNRISVLGQGTFGTVFKGSHKGNVVAVKIVTSEGSSRESNALGLNHENIVRTLEIVQSLEGQNFNLVIMEYLPNCRSLQEVLDSLEQGVMTMLKKFAIDITSGLDYLHRNGIIHLDVKPKNILVDAERVCKICDFGNSVTVGENFNNFKHKGTIIYTAPEILLGREPTIKSDIYSLGLIFWQMRYRKNPFQEYETTESIIYNIGKHDVRPSYVNEKADALQAIFTKCWDSRPEMRPNTAEILNNLQNVRF